MNTFLNIVHVSVCLFLILVVLLQQGRGGGLGSALGGGGAQQVFGGRGAGNILTKATAVCATVFMLTSVSLAFISSSGDRALNEKIQLEQKRKAGATGAKESAPKEAGKAAGGGDKKAEPAPAGSAAK